MNVLSIENLSVYYKNSPALWGINLNIEQGRFVGVIGPNGSGKSTLLKACTGLSKAKTGKIRFFDGKSLSSVRKKIAYLPQRESIDWSFPISAFEVVLMGTYPSLGLFKRPKKEERDYANYCLEQVGMKELSNRQIGELSGGQQQRVFLARALAQKAELYFLDEPFSAIDRLTEEIIVDVIRDLTTKQKTVIVVHHDLFSVKKHTDEVILLNTRLVKHGPTHQVFQKPYLADAFGSQMVNFANLLHETEKSF